jgi:transcriptional regulator with XRE-family HTH domain
MLYYIKMRDDIKKHIGRKPLRLKGLPVDLREKLKEARINRGWSQRELGGKIGLPQPHISAIESGAVVPRFDTLLDIVRVLELDLLLVPRSLVPAVQSLIRAQKEPESVEKPIYAANDEELAPEKRDHDEI